MHRRLDAFYAYLLREGELIMFSPNEGYYPDLGHIRHHVAHLQQAIYHYSLNDMYMHVRDAVSFSYPNMIPILTSLKERYYGTFQSSWRDCDGQTYHRLRAVAAGGFR
jgi:hypothetical protein